MRTFLGADMRYLRCCCIVTLLILSGCHARQAGSTPPIGTRDTLQEQINAAGMRGVGWLVAHRTEMPPASAVTAYRKIYKVTADEDLAAELLGITREMEMGLPQADIPVDVSDSQPLYWHKLRPLLTHLLRRKCAGEEYGKDAAAIEDLLALEWERIFRSNTMLNNKVVAAYFLKEIGIGREDLYDTVVSEVRSKAYLLNDFRTYPYLFYLYALTHIVLTKSDYYDHYLDPSGFGPEMAGFHKALSSYLRIGDMTSTEIDVAAEMLICQKILQVHAPEHTAMLRRLMEHQNADGSWGGKEVDSAKIHTTAVATMALLEFAPEFRKGNVYCDTSTYR